MLNVELVFYSGSHWEPLTYLSWFKRSAKRLSWNILVNYMKSKYERDKIASERTN